MFRFQVIVKTCINSRTNGKLGAWEQVLNSLCHNMSRCVSQSMESFRRILCEKFHLCAIFNVVAKIGIFTVYFGNYCVSSKAVGNSLSGFKQRNSFFKIYFFPIFQNNRYHIIQILSVNKKTFIPKGTKVNFRGSTQIKSYDSL